MSKDNFKTYSEKQIHFMGTDIPKSINNLLRNIDKNVSIIDLGCGDGKFLYTLKNEGLLNNAEKIVGVDLSKERIKRLESSCPFAKGLVSDVCNLVQIEDNSFDLVISSQVVEHVDDVKMLSEIHRIIKPNGYLYISTVIKKWYGCWIYWNNGFRLDPTHIREYKSKEEFIDLLKNNKFDIEEVKVTNVNYPILDLIVRILIKINLMRPRHDFYLQHSTLNKLRSLLSIKIMGYRHIDIIAKVTNNE